MGQNVQEACWFSKFPIGWLNIWPPWQSCHPDWRRGGRECFLYLEGREAYTGSPYLCSSLIQSIETSGLQDSLKGTAWVCILTSATPLLVHWLVKSGETSCLKPQQSLLVCCVDTAALTAPTAGPGDWEDSAPRRLAWEKGRWPSEMLICGSDLAALGEWGALTNGRLNWQPAWTLHSKKSEPIAVMIPSRQGGQGSNKGILSAYSGPEFF